MQPVRGTKDLLGDEMRHYRWIVETARQVVKTYNFEEIATPLFEFSGVFKRLGEETDVVTKETYTFQDRGGEEITLRPEGTAPVVRAVLSNALTQQVPLKFFYEGPMFRYERPQKGRYRQFHQIGIELIGTDNPLGDLECIAMGVHLLKALGVYSSVTLEINTLGDLESRTQYRAILLEYFKKYENELSENSQRRLEKNPLRILDSKDPQDQDLIQGAPVYSDSLTSFSQAFFEKVLRGLEIQGVGYKLNPRLVRGLDYYCHTSFEFTTTALGAQGTVLGGGRYDGLIKRMGGPEIPGVGWAAGVERLILLSSLPPGFQKERGCFFVALGEEAEYVGLHLVHELRAAGVQVDSGYGGSLSKQMKRANKVQAKWALILGDEEIKQQKIAVRWLDSGKQELIAWDHLTFSLKE